LENIKHILKESLDAEKEAMAVAEALQFLAARHGDENCLIYEFADDLNFIMERENYVKEIVAGIDDPYLKSVFKRRYVDKMRWDEISLAEYTSEENLYKIHKKGIDTLERAQRLLYGFN
jgi:hypothetical protein